MQAALAQSRTSSTNSLIDDLDDENRYLTFMLDEERYAFAIRHITEIIVFQKITTLPGVARHVKGVINLRGKVIPVMDVRLRFGLPPRDYNDRTCIVVVEVSTCVVGLIVDTVRDVSTFPDDSIEPSPNLGATSMAPFIDGIGRLADHVYIVLDPERLCARDLKVLETAVQTHATT